MNTALIAFFAYIVDKFVGEFTVITHPVIFIGRYISWFEKKFYKNTFQRGLVLAVSTLGLTYVAIWLLETLLSSLPHGISIFISIVIASMFLAHHMLYHSVLDVINSSVPKEKIKYLVSRDTEDMDDHEIYKACIETYTENINDGVIAPLFYLLLFGLKGLIIFKAISTLDSMVGYKNERYSHFGTAGARLDDIVGWIPARISALLIYLAAKGSYSFNTLKKYASGHESPNSGWPIAAAGLAFHLKLGGPTRYFGAIKNKPYLGDGSLPLTQQDVCNVLTLHSKIDYIVLGSMAAMITFLWLIQ
ncbi:MULTISPECIES: adenosylcobinamide-phosphate synthase CbiB [Sulfurospirillum]|uniref:Cobalamin biosynthesis protein CobD n=4 Tax=Sulfurospirillum TaxID=57665 RepID=A0A1Y0HNI1_9BACT|nr:MULTISPECIES: adenosylcobinamide-phosphate synthase CbiB [Sulfurospirillum]AHJ12803.1 adenosylcobinamide-phosphate synthase CbiB [Sulfurospirillum multivorans DSM 12446]AOO65282.1 adenosylcobinamide-phosphate synthase CbiB [Sulfurospirillum halorespirans DSM 13726]ARU48763.1 adenosylcobinamide-phosphate synthase CbiB [Sulfurospirillum diekertiae]ASC93585.1 adenosylcobinamide-phosphate synthase CbiB [Sulfurospirillum diekertiae]ATB69629.1 adenosylcobinamide-phosphate synthase CbiB [Sulfurosp